MAAPNMVNIGALYGRTVAYPVTTTLAAALSNSAASNKVFKISSIFCSNVDGTIAGEVNVSIYNGTTDNYIIKKLVVPAGASQLIVTKDASLYLEEGCSIRAVATANNDIELLIAYEEIS